MTKLVAHCKMNLRAILFGASLVVLNGCDCAEPKMDYVESQFRDLYPQGKLISGETIEVSPPCVYWLVNYRETASSDSTFRQVWQFCETDKRCEWKMKVTSENPTDAEISRY